MLDQQQYVIYSGMMERVKFMFIQRQITSTIIDSDTENDALLHQSKKLKNIFQKMQLKRNVKF